MNTILTACVFVGIISIFTPLQAQQSWNYSSLREVRLDDAFLIEPPHALKRQIEKHLPSNLKAQTSPLAPQPLNLYNRLYRLSTVSRRSGKGLLRFQADGIDFSLPENIAVQLFPYLVSDGYWRSRYQTLQEWAFVSFDNGNLLSVDTADRRYGSFSPLVWLGYRYQPSQEWPVVFSVRTNTNVRQTLTLPALVRLAEWGSFATPQSIQALEQQQQLYARQQQQQQQQLQQQLDSLDRISSLFARQADSITLVLLQDSINLARQHLSAQVQETKDRMNRDLIFIMSVNTARSDYMFGLEFNLYNCFSKTISKIEISVTPVNDRGQLQKDRFERDIRTVRCMGPILPGSPAQYTFDELFWDDRGRIKFMRLSSIIFHFTDGTRRSFYGYEKILKHTLNK